MAYNISQPMVTVLVMPNYTLVFKVCFTSLKQLPRPANYLPVTLRTQLETDTSRECFSSKCLLSLDDLRTDVKLLTGNGQGEAEE